MRWRRASNGSRAEAQRVPLALSVCAGSWRDALPHILTLPPTHSHSQAEAAAQSLLRQQGQQHSLQESLDQRREAALAYRAQRPLSGV